MFNLLRKMLLVLATALIGGLAYHYLRNADYRRELLQKAEEAEEVLKEGKKSLPWTGTAVVVEVVKGDRARVDLETSSKVLVRLAGIDAPELPKDRYHKGQPLAEQSRAYLNELIKGRAVDLAIVGTDTAKTPLVLLTFEGAFINAKLVEVGLAEVTAETTQGIPAKLRHAIENAELEAKRTNRGIWGLTNYVRPVEFRIRQNNAL